MAKLKQIVTLREKKLSNGNISLYLDIYHNSKRYYYFLKLYPKQNPRTTEERNHNKELYSIAEVLRSEKESELRFSEHDIISPKQRKTDFLDYCDAFLNNYPNTDKRIVKYCIKHFRTFINEEKQLKQLLPNKLTEELISQFKKYLDGKFKGETPYNFFTKFKKICKQAHKEGILKVNTALEVVNTRKEGLKKDILEEKELQKLADTPCKNKEVRSAFFLSLYTGLRFVDIKALAWNQVYDTQIIVKSQKKTGEAVYIDLNSVAIKILNNREGDKSGLVFNLPSHTYCNEILREWTRNAGINKHITWHSSRHSFAVNLLIGRADIKTVSSLLGHASLKHTEKYTRVINALKVKAVNNLPEIEIKQL